MYLISFAYVCFFALFLLQSSRLFLNFGLLLVLFLFLLAGGMAWQATVGFMLLSLFLYQLDKKNAASSNYVTALVEGAVFLIATSLFLHVVPGFTNVLVLDSVSIGNTSSMAYTMYVNYDKALGGLLALLFLCHRKQVIGKVSLAALGSIVLGAVGVAVLALFTLGLHYDPKWLGEASFVFILVKSFSTAFAEEIVFRGWMQGKIEKYTSPFLALVVVSVLFGLVHVGAGWMYVLTALCAGLVYGYIFMKYRSILLAGLCHSFVNIIHFTLLTYPM